MKLEEIASCVAGYDPNALPVAAARDVIAKLLPISSHTESVG